MDRLTVLFAATTVALGATSVWFAQQLASERARADLLAGRVAALESALDPMPGSSKPAVDPTPVVDPIARDAPTEPTASRTVSQSHDTDMRFARFRSNEVQLLRNPQYRESWLANMTLHLRRIYADLQRLLGLSDTEYEAFLAIMAQFEHEQALRGFEAPRQTSLDLAARITAARQQSADAETARRQVLRDALGEAQYREWVDHQRTAAGRRELEHWRIELATAGLSLTPDQAQELLPILVEHQQRMATVPQRSVLPDRADATPASASSVLLDAERSIASRADINAWFDDALTGVLTAEQRELITANGNHDIEIRRAQLELDRLRYTEQGRL